MSAKEMFEELGYKLKQCYSYEKVIPTNTYYYVTSIGFNDRRFVHILTKMVGQGKEQDIVSSLTIEELQAINKQVKELGWLGDKE